MSLGLAHLPRGVIGQGQEGEGNEEKKSQNNSDKES
jgi:hypothetical protein